MPVPGRLILLLLPLACTPATTAPAPASSPASSPATTPTSASSTAPAETCLLGDYRVSVQQRMVQDDGETALLEDQRIGEVPVLFAAQRRALRDRRVQDESGLARPSVPNAPQALLLLSGAEVSEELADVEYVPHPDGAKPRDTRSVTKAYKFFLAESAWDCSAAAAEIDGLRLPRGQVGGAACVPADVRARCVVVDLSRR